MTPAEALASAMQRAADINQGLISPQRDAGFILSALAAAGFVVAPRNVVVNAVMALRLHGSGVIAEGSADQLRDVLAAMPRRLW